MQAPLLAGQSATSSVVIAGQSRTWRSTSALRLLVIHAPLLAGQSAINSAAIAGQLRTWGPTSALRLLVIHAPLLAGQLAAAAWLSRPREYRTADRIWPTSKCLLAGRNRRGLRLLRTCMASARRRFDGPRVCWRGEPPFRSIAPYFHRATAGWCGLVRRPPRRGILPRLRERCTHSAGALYESRSYHVTGSRGLGF